VDIVVADRADISLARFTHLRPRHLLERALVLVRLRLSIAGVNNNKDRCRSTPARVRFRSSCGGFQRVEDPDGIVRSGHRAPADPRLHRPRRADVARASAGLRGS
jgi:hypothetical protein